MITLYEYRTCSTCRAAVKFLTARGTSFERRSIVDTPPSKADLARMLQHLRESGFSLKHLFNTAGESYRAGGLAARFQNEITDDDALTRLAADGKLIKRPFLLTTRGGVVGFNPGRWAELLDQETS